MFLVDMDNQIMSEGMVLEGLLPWQHNATLPLFSSCQNAGVLRGLGAEGCDDPAVECPFFFTSSYVPD